VEVRFRFRRHKLNKVVVVTREQKNQAQDCYNHSREEGGKS